MFSKFATVALFASLSAACISRIVHGAESRLSAGSEGPVADRRVPGPHLRHGHVEREHRDERALRTARQHQAPDDVRCARRCRAAPLRLRQGGGQREVTLFSLAAGSGDSRWRVPAALTATVQKLQAESGGASGLFVVVHQESICSNRTSTMKDSQGRAIATVESSDVTCEKAPYVNVDAMLFTSGGDLIWHGAEAVNPNSDDQIAGLFARVPADFADPPKVTPSPPADLPRDRQ